MDRVERPSRRRERYRLSRSTETNKARFNTWTDAAGLISSAAECTNSGSPHDAQASV